jgi:hypothetical protein
MEGGARLVPWRPHRGTCAGRQRTLPRPSITHQGQRERLRLVRVPCRIVTCRQRTRHSEPAVSPVIPQRFGPGRCAARYDVMCPTRGSRSASQSSTFVRTASSGMGHVPGMVASYAEPRPRPAGRLPEVGREQPENLRPVEDGLVLIGEFEVAHLRRYPCGIPSSRLCHEPHL